LENPRFPSQGIFSQDFNKSIILLLYSRCARLEDVPWQIDVKSASPNIISSNKARESISQKHWRFRRDSELD